MALAATIHFIIIIIILFSIWTFIEDIRYYNDVYGMIQINYKI